MFNVAYGRNARLGGGFSSIVLVCFGVFVSEFVVTVGIGLLGSISHALVTQVDTSLTEVFEWLK
jgi:hypothetical protein